VEIVDTIEVSSTLSTYIEGTLKSDFDSSASSKEALLEYCSSKIVSNFVKLFEEANFENFLDISKISCKKFQNANDNEKLKKFMGGKRKKL
jgi:hypothetical protein